jgi:hypothetical protein
LRYTTPGGQQTTKALKSRDAVVAESWEDKAELIKEEAFPKPLKGPEEGPSRGRRNVENDY